MSSRTSTGTTIVYRTPSHCDDLRAAGLERLRPILQLFGTLELLPCHIGLFALHGERVRLSLQLKELPVADFLE